MTCRNVRSSLSLYLYGELDFAQEEEIEIHLAQCAACQLSLTREKQWHTLTNAQAQEPPLDLLAECRQQLRPAIARETAPRGTFRSWWRWSSAPFVVATNRWSARLALASFLVFVGFATARLLDHGSLRFPSAGPNEMGVLNPANTFVRDIQTGDSGQVRIIVDQQSEVSGRVEDAAIRRLLLAGAHQPEADVRFYSLQLLTQQTGGTAIPPDDIRQVLFEAVRSDPNPAVRLEAMDGLRRFTADPAALEAIKFVLEHDDNPGVRYQAIDILVPPGGAAPVTPAITQTIQEVLLSAPDDEYLRARCSQVLHEAKVAVVY